VFSPCSPLCSPPPSSRWNSAVLPSLLGDKSSAGLSGSPSSRPVDTMEELHINVDDKAESQLTKRKQEEETEGGVADNRLRMKGKEKMTAVEQVSNGLLFQARAVRLVNFFSVSSSASVSSSTKLPFSVSPPPCALASQSPIISKFVEMLLPVSEGNRESPHFSKCKIDDRAQKRSHALLEFPQSCRTFCCNPVQLTKESSSYT